ncbi:MAG: hypothetical protein IKK82_00260 [Kiritimatiellae bacterium]|nr:hypothetical protein [Eggerthellaceae bacterium]MBR6585823.1 hypothetical protein [Kiritimatiellia bacterium]
MEKTTRYAEIPQLKKGVAFSDPSYDSTVWCCYQKEFHPSSGWVMKMESTRDDDGYVDFALSLGRKTTMSGLRVVEDEEGAAIHHYKHHEIESKEIGIDTARVFVGSLDNFEKWGEDASIYTAADGLFGDLQIITCKGEDEPAGFLLMGAVDGDITSEDDLFRTITAGFDGHEIDKLRFEKLTNREDLQLRMELAKEIKQAKAFEKSDKSQPEKGKGEPER